MSSIRKLDLGHHDQFEPVTQRERGYIQIFSSIYKTDCIKNPTRTATNAIEKKRVIGSISVFTQDADFEDSGEEDIYIIEEKKEGD